MASQLGVANLPERDAREGRRPLMRIPLWYKDNGFQYNKRCGLGFLLGTVLMGVVCGKTLVAMALFVLMVNLLLRSLGYEMIQIGLVVASVFTCQIVNFYCMLPLIWHSVLNIPLLMIFHTFIVIVGLWAIIQIEEFRKQDPRVSLLVERGLFIVLPAINLVIVSWLVGVLAGRSTLPLALAMTGIFLVSLFVMPLQSSFVKPGTPPLEGLILPRPIGLGFLLLIVLLPGIVFSALQPGYIFSEIKHILWYQLFFTTPAFVLTLFEAQGIFEWFGDLSQKAILSARWGLGLLTMISLSVLLSYSPSSTNLPTLSIPLLFSFFGFISSLSNRYQHQKLSLLTGTLLAVMVILVVAMATQLPWNIIYYFSMLSLPLNVLQIVLVLLCLVSFLLLLGWQKDLTLLWPTYHAVFVGCEFVLNTEGLYSLSLQLVTAFAAILLCLRLHTIGRLPLPLTILCGCLHILKLSHFFPIVAISSFTSSLTLIVCLLIVYSLLNIISSDGITLKMLILICSVITFGVGLALPTLAIPLLTAVTHTTPSIPDLVALAFVISGVLINHYLNESAASKTCRSYLPYLFFMAGLLWLLQPDFNPIEIHEAVGVVFLHYGNVNMYLGRVVTTEQLLIMAWIVIVKWIVVLYAIIAIGSLSLKLCLPEVTKQAAWSLLAASSSILASLKFGHHTPLSALGVLYGLSGLIGGFLLILIVLKKPQTPSWFEGLLLLFLSGLCVITLFGEWNSLPSHVTDYVSLPSGVLFLIMFVSITAALKIKSVTERGRQFLPLLCNTSCLIAYLLAISIQLPVHLDKALTVSLASCIFLFLQSDGVFISTSRTSSGLFLAPTLICSSLTLFVISFLRIVEDLSVAITIMRTLELFCLLALIPGQTKFLYCLLKGSPVRFGVVSLFLYILPNALIVQYGGSVNIVLGSTAILCFSLLAIAELQTVFVL